MEKEFRVFVINTDNIPNFEKFSVTPLEIDEWDYEEQLPEKAHQFIALVEKYGKIFSLPEYSAALKLSNGNLPDNESMFVTNKYRVQTKKQKEPMDDKQPEFRAYVVNPDNVPDDEKFLPNGINIDLWNDEEKLPDDAKRFIELAEKHGDVYSLKGFLTAFNIANDINSFTQFIFITNKYNQ